MKHQNHYYNHQDKDNDVQDSVGHVQIRLDHAADQAGELVGSPCACYNRHKGNYLLCESLDDSLYQSG